MINMKNRIWNKLRFAWHNPSYIPKSLSTRFSNCFRKRFSIQERIISQQKHCWGSHLELTKEEIKQQIFTSEEEKRIEYYLGDIAKTPVSLDPETPVFDPACRPYKLIVADYDLIYKAVQSDQLRDGYTLPLLNLFNLLPDEYKNKKFLYKAGDHTRKIRFPGLLAKARQREDRAVTLLNLNPLRHWKELYNTENRDVAYQHKKDMAVWRGATTGVRKTRGRRIDLVNKFFATQQRFDVGYSIVTGKKNAHDYPVKDLKSIEELLQYKFLICLEGNDVASGLKWMLQSNSVVMMPRPSISGWLMEDALKPFVHYIPLADDFSDAENQFEWAMCHPDECLEISKNATRYMSQFLAPRNEVLIEREVFRRYLNQISFL